MCSRYSLTSPPEAVRSYFGYVNTPNFPPRYNIAPTQPVGIVRLDEQRQRKFELVRWGLIPGWLKDPRQFSVLVNARSETVLEKPSFRGGIRHRRCLVPADAFYEWTGARGAKRPFMIEPRNRGVMGFAGIWDHWLGADGSELESMAILTVPANAEVAPLHDRMPAILMPESFEAWLDTRACPADVAVSLLAPAPGDFLSFTEIDRAINNVRHEGAELQRPVGPSSLL